MAEAEAGAAVPDAPPGDAISVRGIATGAGLIVLAIAISLAVAFTLMHYWSRGANGGTSTAPGALPRIEAAPMLQPDPQRDIARYRAEKERLLARYGWIDRDRGIVRIPVTRAMEALARGEAKGPAP